LYNLAVILHDGPHTNPASPWPYILLGIGALLFVAILAGLWWAGRRLPPEMDESQDG
jgi:hypothetical protein